MKYPSYPEKLCAKTIRSRSSFSTNCSNHSKSLSRSPVHETHAMPLLLPFLRSTNLLRTVLVFASLRCQKIHSRVPCLLLPQLHEVFYVSSVALLFFSSLRCCGVWAIWIKTTMSGNLNELFTTATLIVPASMLFLVFRGYKQVFNNRLQSTESLRDSQVLTHVRISPFVSTKAVFL